MCAQAWSWGRLKARLSVDRVVGRGQGSGSQQVGGEKAGIGVRGDQGEPPQGQVGSEAKSGQSPPRTSWVMPA